MHLVEGAGLLKSTQAVDDGTEEPEKDQRTILIPKLMSAQVAIACLVTLRPNEVQPFDQALQRLEILQAVDVFRAYLAASCCHGSHYGNFEPRAQLSPPPWIRWFLWRKFRAEHYWDGSDFCCGAFHGRDWNSLPSPIIRVVEYQDMLGPSGVTCC